MKHKKKIAHEKTDADHPEGFVVGLAGFGAPLAGGPGMAPPSRQVQAPVNSPGSLGAPGGGPPPAGSMGGHGGGGFGGGHGGGGGMGGGGMGGGGGAPGGGH